VYVAAFLLLADSPTAPPPSTVRRICGLVAAVASMSWLFNGDTDLPDTGWVVAIGLLGAAVALWRGQAPTETLSAPPVVEPQSDSQGGQATDHWESLATEQPKRPRPPRSPLGLLTIGAATVVGSLVWLFNEDAGNRGVWAFGWATVVLGLGLLVGAFAGRARWLIFPAIATTIAALAASALSFAGVDLDHRSGDRTEVIGAGSTVAARYRTGVGDFELIIADYPRDLTTDVEVGVGNLTVVVPDDVRVQVDARIGIGAIDALGSSRNGYRRALALDNNIDAEPTITLRLRVGIGNIEVRRGSFFDGSAINLPDVPTLPGVPTLPAVPDTPASQVFGDGTVLFDDGSISFGDGLRIEANGTYQIPIVAQNDDGSMQLENGATLEVDGTVVSPGGFVIHRPDRVTDAPTITATTIIPGDATEVQP
jgi:Cell wall-active antibiotics response 4TMS YvqF